MNLSFDGYDEHVLPNMLYEHVLPNMLYDKILRGDKLESLGLV